MVLLTEQDVDDCEIVEILCWDESMIEQFMYRMKRFGWETVQKDNYTYIVHPDPSQWWIRRKKTSYRYWYESSKILYNPRYDIYYHGCCVAQIDTTVLRHSTNYQIRWHEESFRWIEQWEWLSSFWEDAMFSTIHDFFIGKKISL